MTRFDTPRDFLRHVKASEADPYPEQTPSPEYLALHLAEMEQVGFVGINPEAWFDDYFPRLLIELANVVEEPVSSTLNRHVTVGCLDHIDVNAFITRSDDGEWFAILFHRALLSLMTQHVKLVVAANHPSSVLYCNGVPPSTLSRADYIAMNVDMLKRYGATGEPHGIELKLAQKSEAATRVEFTLLLMNLFVLGHELGHYINGDLGNAAHFAKVKASSDAAVFSVNISHAMEFAADKVAFELLLRNLASKDPTFSARRVLDLAVTGFFDFLRDIDNRGSTTHPRPSDRLLAVVREFFGDAAADIMRKSFSDLSQIEEFRKTVGDQSVGELLKSRS
jgi:hypothetical protein